MHHKEIFSEYVQTAYGGFYDNAGNQTTVTRDGTADARAYNDDNELLSTDDGNTTRDAKGNMTEDAEGNKYFYDLDNRINEIQMDGGDTIELAYDALGRRVFRKNGSDETAYLWWGDQETSEHKSSAGQPVIQNDLWAHPTALNKICARAVDGDKNDIEYYHKNYLDHVYAVSDDSGSIKEHYRYSAFGEVEIYSPAGAKLAVSAIDNGVMWNSRRFDADTGLYYYKYRHYAAQLGRWLGRDPIEEESGQENLYEFVGNEPIFSWDAMGLIKVTITIDRQVRTEYQIYGAGSINSDSEEINKECKLPFNFKTVELAPGTEMNTKIDNGVDWDVRGPTKGAKKSAEYYRVDTSKPKRNKDGKITELNGATRPETIYGGYVTAKPEWMDQRDYNEAMKHEFNLNGGGDNIHSGKNARSSRGCPIIGSKYVPTRYSGYNPSASEHDKNAIRTVPGFSASDTQATYIRFLASIACVKRQCGKRPEFKVNISKVPTLIVGSSTNSGGLDKWIKHLNATVK